MEIKTTILPNHLKVITHKMPTMSAVVGAFVDAGTRHEKPTENGIAHFNEHMAFKGTNTRSAFDISHEIEILGASMNAATSICRTNYHVSGLSEHVPIGLDIIGDVLSNSEFDQDEIKSESGVVLQEMAQYEDDVATTVFELLTAVGYPNQPVGRRILGDKDFISNATSQNFRDFMCTNYGGDTMIVIAVGDIDHDEVVDSAAKSFSNIQPTITRPEVIPAEFVGGIKINGNTKFSQAGIGIMFNSVNFCDDDHIIHQMLMDAFGRGMSSPLFTEIREKRGLVYHTSSFSDFETDHGNVGFFGLLTPDNMKEFVTVSCEEFVKLLDTISENDLLRAKNSMLVRTALYKERTSTVMNHIASQILIANTDKVKGFEQLRNEIRAVTIEDLKQAAANIMKSKPAIALVGPVPEIDYEGIVKSIIG